MPFIRDDNYYTPTLYIDIYLLRVYKNIYGNQID